MAGLKEHKLLAELLLLKPVPTTTAWVTTIHSPEYLERVKASVAEGAAYLDTRDVPLTADSYMIALLAAGGVQVAVDAVMDGRVKNAFCLIRPPGHHALKDKAMGFCIFNNVAIAARYLQQKHHLAKILIVDWDVHHGNGTQAAFYNDPTVVYFSVHQHPAYPNTGLREERGEGAGTNTTYNVPLQPGSSIGNYKRAFHEVLVPAAANFKPDFVLISAGFDALENDPIGRMKLTAADYAELTRIVKDIANQYCHGRLVSALEGGYDPQNLAAAVEAHLRELMK